MHSQRSPSSWSVEPVDPADGVGHLCGTKLLPCSALIASSCSSASAVRPYVGAQSDRSGIQAAATSNQASLAAAMSQNTGGGSGGSSAINTVASVERAWSSSSQLIRGRAALHRNVVRSPAAAPC